MNDILNKSTVLVLNRHWQAIDVKTAEAFCMIATGAATVLDVQTDFRRRPLPASAEVLSGADSRHVLPVSLEVHAWRFPSVCEMAVTSTSLSVAVTRGPRRIRRASLSSSPIFTGVENARPSGEVVW